MGVKNEGYKSVRESKLLVRTLEFIFIVATTKVLKESRVVMEHTIGSGIYGEIIKKTELTEEELKNIDKKMREIINMDLPINSIHMDKDDALKIFRKDYPDKVLLLKNVNRDNIHLYEIDGVYDYFYGPMAESTGAIKDFNLFLYNDGFVLMHSLVEDGGIENYASNKKLISIFKETKRWLNILNVAEVGSLNNKIVKGESKDIVMVSEALQEKRIAEIADMVNEKGNIKVVLIAGPSSSGKTTFCNRLAIQLRVNGNKLLPISIDDYFLDREDTPKDENGEYDFESINALDLELFNNDLSKILKGEEISVPTYNFKEGKKEWKGKKVKLPPGGIVILEGIHGLNPMLTSCVEDSMKFKVYISALTQLNIDYHNRISTTDVRKIRRIVRDNLSRGYGAEETLLMWPKIKAGEVKNIFPYQENADVMFNSMLVYELSILKKYALVELLKIKEDSSVYNEAKRLISFLELFKDIDENYVLENSIIREFIGGSIFYEY